jgi:hypothetical protein
VAVRSRVLGFNNALAVATTTLFTVASDRTAVVRTIDAQNSNATLASQMIFRINRAGATIAIWAPVIPAATVQTQEIWRVLNPGDLLEVQPSQTGGRVAVYGALLLGAPS